MYDFETDSLEVELNDFKIDPITGEPLSEDFCYKCCRYSFWAIMPITKVF